MAALRLPNSRHARGAVMRRAATQQGRRGQALHRQLGEHVSHPQYCYLHKWQAGDFVIWDNRATLHRARAYDMAKYRRVFRRTTIAGAGPVQGPFSQAV